MKHGGDYARRLKRLFHQLIRKHGRPAPVEPTDPLEQILVAILAGGTSHHRAVSVFRKLREQMVDLNELRVTPVTELARQIGPTIPLAEVKAQRMVDVLNDIRRRHDTLDLSFLNQRGRREAREYLESLEGVDRATAASVVLFSLGGHALPVDEVALHVLRKDGVVDPSADVAEVQSFLERHISASDAQAFAQVLDRHVASRGIRVAAVQPADPEEAASPQGGRAEGQRSSEVNAAPPMSKSGAAQAAAETDKSRSAPKRSGPANSKGPTKGSSARSTDHRRKAAPRHTPVKAGKTNKRG